MIKSLLWLRWDFHICYMPRKNISKANTCLSRVSSKDWTGYMMCLFASFAQNQYHDLDGYRETAMASNKIHDEWCHEFSVDSPSLP
jgi:hypothetical protein